jgi:hypothetical protein
MADSVGVATMQEDGTLRLQLRSEGPRGIAEALKVVKPDDPQYAYYVRHLGNIRPGESKGIPPFP